MRLSCVWLLMAMMLVCAWSLRIVQFVPGFTNSHVLFNYRLAATLTALGHNVTMWTQMELAMVPDKVVQPPAGVTEYTTDIHFHDRLQTEGLKVFQSMMFNESSTWALWSTGQQFRSMRVESCEQMLTSPVLRRLRPPPGGNPSFDLAIGHFHDLCPVALAHQLNVGKVVWVTHGTSLYDYNAHLMGLHTYPSYVPHPLSPCSDSMDFSHRVISLMWHLSTLDFVNLPQNLLHEENEMYQKFSPTMSLWELAARVKVLFLNGEGQLDFPRPLPIGINFMGDVSSSTTQRPLDATFRAIMDSSVKGVIIFSLGTVSNTSSMPDRMKYGFLEAFSRFPDYTILWRLEMELPEAETYKNIRLLRWLPQQELMRHPKTRLLIAHGGYNSLLETAKAGVPCLLMPLFADQHINAKRALRHRIGLVLDKLTVDADQIEQAMRRVLTDSSYKTNAVNLASMLRDKPVDSKIVFSHHLKSATKTNYPGLRGAQRLATTVYHAQDVIGSFILLSAVLTLAIS